MKPTGLGSLVRKKDRIKHAKLIELLKNFQGLANKTENFHQVVGKITDKILKWKKSFGDLDK